MDFSEIKEKNEFDSFLSAAGPVSFLQSWGWGEMLKRDGVSIKRLGLYDQNELMAATTLVVTGIGAGYKYYYSPCGPVLGKSKNNPSLLKIFSEKIGLTADKEKVLFWRIEPAVAPDKYAVKAQKTIDIQPPMTLLVDLGKSEEALLAEMHPKTRYNIKLSAQKGIEIAEVGLDKFEQVWEIMKETVRRDGFRLHEKSHYENLLKSSDGMIKLLAAFKDRKMLALIFLCFFNDTVIYLHGASSNENRNLMAPYALQWQGIRLAKAKGAFFYDFYGINEEKWPGVTRFKKGFGGNVSILPGTYDIVFKPNYYRLYNFLRLTRRRFAK